MTSPKPDRDDPWVLHFTPLENLAGIVASGLLADNFRPPGVQECGMPSIKGNRRRRAVPLAPHGVVADYVPFYFAEKSPMLNSIVKGGVPTYQGTESELIYLVSRVSKIEEHGRRWLATDRNAVLRTARFVDDRSRLPHHIDWDVMEARYWYNTADDGSRKERRMAELLVHEHVPWEAFVCLAACCGRRADEVERIAAASGHRPSVYVRTHWYFGVPRDCECGGG
ncbi:DUF4433 domain-containing protein [Actinocorallia sp. API 0066]|uniref:type II toxin-antitoxin system toxin DNA ADP-ribosyl transferase DarT n=1 Tax=Actinocorallia sp. API 0066 TaxID=2896846 RepID=UPI001E5D750E|nr:DUF4433 domain-containing protein [Actinocorallia sp. API 0066]MCD0451180.1 DUF4433 domain-containing protein [Actinocorallia sp. API 0066]